MIDVHAVGAGGGSIAHLDNAGALKVGPESAGANPGPVAYGLGGTDPVVTDANLTLGRINPNYVLGGRMKINAELSRKAIEEKLAKPMNTTIEKAADGIISVVNSNMARAIRVITVERGYNPSDFALVAYGGAGPLHAVNLAQEMGIKTVIIPPNPGTLCSLGLLTADIRRSYVKTAIMQLDQASAKWIDECLQPLMEKGNEWLSSEAVAQEKRHFRNVAEMRYVGQNYELQIPLPDGPMPENILKTVKQKFFEEHEKNYGYYNADAPVQFVNFRSESIGEVAKPTLSKLTSAMENPSVAQIDTRKVYFADAGFVDSPIYQRERFGTCKRVNGPCIIEQMDSTTVIPPETWFEVDEYGNLIVHV